MIRYANGSKDVFNEATTTTSDDNQQQMLSIRREICMRNELLFEFLAFSL